MLNAIGRASRCGPPPGPVRRQPARHVRRTRCRSTVATSRTGVGSWHQKFQVVRRTPDALGNRVIGYLGGIDINQNRLDTPGHHGRAWTPPGRGVEHAVGAGVPRRARPGHRARRRRRRADLRSAAGSSTAARQPAGTPAAPSCVHAPDGDRRGRGAAAARAPPRAGRPQRLRARRRRRQRAAAVVAGRRGDDPARPSSARSSRPASTSTSRTSTSRRPTTYIHALLDASVREPSLRLLIVIPTSSDQLFGDIRRREMFERLRDDPATGRGWGDRMIVGAPGAPTGARPTPAGSRARAASSCSSRSARPTATSR